MRNDSWYPVKMLPLGGLDIVGDVHGEYELLLQLVSSLGYTMEGFHPQARTLVFIGDMCDRGLNSPAVIKWIKGLEQTGRAFAILGNHEINLLAQEIKDGSGWFFSSQYPRDLIKYGNLAVVEEEEKAPLLTWLSQLPLVLAREDIRIVHACWDRASIADLESLKAESALAAYQYYEESLPSIVKQSEHYKNFLEDLEFYEDKRADPNFPMPRLTGLQARDLLRSQYNRVRILASGPEQTTEFPFYAGGRWRFTTRLRWWDYYLEDVTVVFGHYWRLLKERTELFSESPLAWLGPRHNCFCNDYSAGAKWRERKQSRQDAVSDYHLVALRWPEKVLFTDTGEILPTIDSE